MAAIRVVVADDLALFREGIRSALRNAPDIEVIEASGTGEALELAKELHPEIVLIDAEMPDGDSFRTTREINEAVPGCHVIVMTEKLDDLQALEAIEAGAVGYVLKDIPRDSLVNAILSVCNGRAVFHPELSRTVLDELGRLARQERSRRHRLEWHGLTQRELEILMELTKGQTDTDIARKFVVSEGTIKTHIHNILRKLGCRNRTQAVAYVLRKGLIK